MKVFFFAVSSLMVACPLQSAACYVHSSCVGQSVSVLCLAVESPKIMAINVVVESFFAKLNSR